MTNKLEGPFKKRFFFAASLSTVKINEFCGETGHHESRGSGSVFFIHNHRIRIQFKKKSWTRIGFSTNSRSGDNYIYSVGFSIEFVSFFLSIFVLFCLSLSISTHLSIFFIFGQFDCAFYNYLHGSFFSISDLDPFFGSATL